MEYGYIRVSSADQNVARQVDALHKAGIKDENIFTDKMSGKNFNRPSWKRLLHRLKEGDLIVVLSPDRLGRNYEDIIEQWRMIIKTRKANIKVLDMPLLDTTNKSNGLIGVFVADLVLQLLSFVAESERTNIRERQRQGIDAAKKRGVKFGRPRKIDGKTLKDCISKIKNGEMKVAEAAQICCVSESTIRRRKTESESKSTPIDQGIWYNGCERRTGNEHNVGFAAGNGGGSKRICCGSGIVLGKLSLRMPKTRVLKASGREKEDGET